MKSSFVKNLGPIRYSAIKELFESTPINIDEKSGKLKLSRKVLLEKKETKKE